MKYDKLIFELSKANRIGYALAKSDIPELNLEAVYQKDILREQLANLPEVSELDVVRHYTNVSKLNFGIETGFYPLGSCTMKYNPKINEVTSSMPGFRNIHPLSEQTSIQSILKLYKETEHLLNDITGMAATSLFPFAGAHGELAGLMIIKAYHQSRGDYHRKNMIIPDSAHGTNPASAAMLGFNCITIKSTKEGLVDLEALREHLDENLAGIMLTNPNTLGLFEKDILSISHLIHHHGGLLYYDGANLNPLLGVARPGDMGFDVMHMNLHKTFSTPHGGGGPGSGPISVAPILVDFLPNPKIVKVDKQYQFGAYPHSIGHITSYFGNFLVVVRAYTYLKTMGTALSKVGPLSVLNANYIKEKLRHLYSLPIDQPYMHEFVFNGLIDQSTDVKTLDIAKRLLDYGVHAPTIYFPLLFDQSIMIEPTEVESLETIDQFITVMETIALEAINNPDLVKLAPHHTPVGRIDEVGAARNPILTYQDYVKSL